MNKFSCSGFRTISAETMSEAGQIFATRMARKTYGNSGYCRTHRIDSYSRDGKVAEFDCFVGYTTGHNVTTGHNIRLTVSRSEDR